MFVCKTRHLVLAGGSKVRWAWWHPVHWVPGSALQPSLTPGVTRMGLWRTRRADVSVRSLAKCEEKVYWDSEPFTKCWILLVLLSTC